MVKEGYNNMTNFTELKRGGGLRRPLLGTLHNVGWRG